MTTPPDDEKPSPGAPDTPHDDSRGPAASPSASQPGIAPHPQDALARLLDRRSNPGADHGEALLRALVDASPLAMWVLDPEARVVVWNNAAERLTGWSADEVLGRPVPTIPANKTDEFRELFGRALKKQTVVDAEVRREKKDGSPVDLSLSTAPLVAGDGAVVAVLVMAADLTARKEAEDAARRLASERAAREAADAARERLAGIVESISDAYTAYDREWRYTYMNRRYAALIKQNGRDPDTLMGQVVWDAFPEIVGTKFHTEAMRAANESQPVEFDEHYAPLDQTFNVRVFPTPDGFVSITRDVTARRRAERALERSESRFRSLVEASAQIVWSTDAEGRIVTPIAEWGAITGQSPEQSKGYGMLDTVHPDERDEVGRLWRDAIANKRPFAATFRLRVAEGTYRWFAARGVPVLNGDGTVREWVGTSSDIHERKSAEAALRESEARFRIMADSAPVMLWVTEGDASCSFLNRRWYEFTGQTPETGLGFGWLDAVHPEDADRTRTVFARANEHREAFSLDYRLRTRAGVYRWAIDSASPRFGPTGEFLGYIGSVTDIDERRQMEDALRASEARHRRIFGTAGVSIWEEDFSAVKEAIDALKAEGVSDIRRYLAEHRDFVARAASLVRVRDVNEASVDMFGARDKSELLASLDRVFVDETLDVFADQIAAVFEERSRLQSEAPLQTLDGRRLQVAFTVAFPSDDPQLRSVLVSMLDITERKRVEAERERLFEAERTARAESENARREADTARAVAEQASRAKSDFLATMSHELRTPLNAIIGYESLLADGVTGPVTDTQRRQLERIGASAHHLLMLIDEVLTLSRVEAGKEVIHIEPVDIARVLDEAATIIEPLAKQKNLEFEAIEPPAQITIQSDAGKLRQAILNLLSNAVKFTGRGRVTLRASEAGDDVIFEVRDTGIGIAAEHLDRIFEPFWQVEASTTRTAPGTGLGLAVTRRLAHLLGGKVTVQSAMGEGTTFILRLPRAGPQS